MSRFHVLIFLFSLLILDCSTSTTKSLTEAEKAKLDPPLLHLLTSKPIDENQLDIFTRPDGTKEYTIIVRSDQSEEIKKMGFAISSAFGDVMVARVTIEELRKIVSLPSVRSIEAGSKNFIQRQKKQ